MSEDPNAPHGRDGHGQPLAPYGLTVDGKPKKTPGGRKPSSSRRARSTRPRPASRKPAQKSYVEGISGLLAIPAFGLQLAGRTRRVFAADAAAIAMHGEQIAVAVDELAQENAEIAAILDRFLKAGPYGALLTAVAPLAFQLLANRGVLPPGAMGTHDPGVLILHAQAQAQAMAAHYGVPQEYDMEDRARREREEDADFEESARIVREAMSEPAPPDVETLMNNARAAAEAMGDGDPFGSDPTVHSEVPDHIAVPADWGSADGSPSAD